MTQPDPNPELVYAHELAQELAACMEMLAKCHPQRQAKYYDELLQIKAGILNEMDQLSPSVRWIIGNAKGNA